MLGRVFFTGSGGKWNQSINSFGPWQVSINITVAPFLGSPIQLPELVKMSCEGDY